MAAPVASFVQLPLDTANTGKKNRTQTKVVGSNTVHEHFMAPTPAYTMLGRYLACSTVIQAISSASQSPTTSGFYWLHNSSANTAVGVLRSVKVSYSMDASTAASITQSAPQLVLTKYTFNTAHSGTTLNIVPVATSTTAAKLNLRSAPTGPTITAVGPIGVGVMPALVSTAGTYGGEFSLYDSMEHYNRGYSVELAPGEGVSIHQNTTGLATDSRRFIVKFVWDEIDVS